MAVKGLGSTRLWGDNPQAQIPNLIPSHGSQWHRNVTVYGGC